MLLKIWCIAQLVLIDGLRRHAILGLVLLAFSLEVAGLLFIDFIPRDIGRAATDFILTVGWLTGLLFLLFHAVQVMAWGEERRAVHTLLARPISRSQYVIGVFTGLCILLILLNATLAALGYGILLFIKGSVKIVYFTHLSTATYIISWVGLFCVQSFILSWILLFSGLVRGSFPVLILTVSYYFICTGLPVVRESLVMEGEIQDSLLTTLLTICTAIFPDFSKFDFKTLVTSGIDKQATYFLTTDLFLFMLYSAIILMTASFVYQKRDLQ